MRWVKDSVHGDIYVTPVVDELMDTPEMQRLRRISQTAFCYLLYPGANHNRFEHSLGTYYLTKCSCEMHDVKNSELLEVAALLHDVGHTCFSHTLEELTKKKTGKTHEEFTREKIRKGNIARVLKEHGLQPGRVAKFMDKPEYELVHGYLGTDKIDYLLRDSKYTGVAYGSVDADRLMRKTMLRKGELVLEEKGLSVAEALLLARFMMYNAVYAHHVSYAAEEMAARATEQAIKDGVISVNDLVELDDWQLTSILREQEGLAGKLMNSILNRRLYKKALHKPLKTFKNWRSLLDLPHRRVRELEEQIALQAGLEKNDVILQTPVSWFKEIKTRVLRDGRLIDVTEVSVISRVLRDAQWDYSYVTVLCPEEKKKKVKPGVARIIESA